MEKRAYSSLTFVLIVISILSLLIVSCQLEPSIQYTYRQPENINDGFDVGSLDEVNIHAKLIEKAVNEIRRGKYDEVHSMLIFKDNKLVFEEYFEGHKFQWDAPGAHGELVTWDSDMEHPVMSVTKSITSTCIGIALDEGFIESVNQSIFDYLPEHQHLNTEGKDKITIEHLLTMTSGLEWDEWGASLTSGDNDITGLWFYCGEDPINCILERPLVDEPGTSFTYSGGNMIVLGEIIKNATKMNLDEFSRQYLFEPLEIDSFNWDQFQNGVIDGAGGLRIIPRDMAKIGVTFLNKGVWNGKQIISEQWVEKSATSFPGNHGINIPGVDFGRNGYSYSWWIKPFSNSGKEIHMYYAGGWGGQYIMVIPEQNTVVVFTGGNYQTKVQVFKILKEYVIPAFN